jgi:hypothetical protein
MATPSSNQLARLFAHRDCHLDRTLRWVGARYRIVEEHHDPVTGELVERPFELGDERPQRAVIFAQKFEDLLGLGGFSEGGVATMSGGITTTPSASPTITSPGYTATPPQAIGRPRSTGWCTMPDGGDEGRRR